MYCIASAVDLTVVSNLSLVSMTPVCEAYTVLVCFTSADGTDPNIIGVEETAKF